MVSTCRVCKKIRSEPVKALVHPWTFPSKPWSILLGLLLVHVGSSDYSKFSEVFKSTSTTATATIIVQQDLISRYGPLIMVSDNVTQLIGCEFQQFCRKYGIINRTSTVYKHSTNEQVFQILNTL